MIGNTNGLSRGKYWLGIMLTVRSLKEMSKTHYIAPQLLATGGLGDKDRAFEWLGRAYTQRSMNPFYIPDPRYDSLRADSRDASGGMPAVWN